MLNVIKQKNSNSKCNKTPKKFQMLNVIKFKRNFKFLM